MDATTGAAAPSNARLILRILEPSQIGIMLYFVLAVVVVGGHLVNISLSGQAFPASFNDTLLQWYANVVIQPLATVFNSNVAANVLYLLGCGLAGLLVYEGAAFIIRTIQDVHDSAADISQPAEGVMIRHPMERSVLLRILWRLFVGVAIVGATIAVQPLVHFCLANDDRIVAAARSINELKWLLVNIAIWMAVCHGYVILLRLYLLRTRLLGEIVY